jgi:hypothetical protein
LILPISSLKLKSSTCSSFWLTTCLLSLVGVFFNRQSAYLCHGYKLCSTCRQLVPLLAWGFSRKTKRSYSRSINFRSLNNSRFGDFADRIYPIELEIKDTTDTDTSASYLDLHLEIDSERWLRTKLYDKRDDFNFPIVNFPFLCGNIPAAPEYGVYISQLIRYSRACCSYQDFLDRGLLITKKLLNQGFLLANVKSSPRKFYCRHHDLVDHYGISVSQMTTDMFHLS